MRFRLYEANNYLRVVPYLCYKMALSSKAPGTSWNFLEEVEVIHERREK